MTGKGGTLRDDRGQGGGTLRDDRGQGGGTLRDDFLKLALPGNLQPFEMDPGSVIPDLIRDRGDGLLRDPGFVRPHSVIPGLTITCLDPRSGPIPSFRA
jgi:hypothetical protein